MTLPTEAPARKAVPLATGVLDYFPDALAEVARVSKAGNDQHNPGQPLHWDKSKSTDHADCLLRHLAERETFDSDGMRHTAKVAWRALALLQTELERDPQPEEDQAEQSNERPDLATSEDLRALMVSKNGRMHGWDQFCGEYGCRRAKVADVAASLDVADEDDVSFDISRWVNG